MKPLWRGLFYGTLIYLVLGVIVLLVIAMVGS